MTFKYDVKGMTCAACSATVEKVTRKIPGVTKADVNLLGGTMVVEADTDVTERIIADIANAYSLSESKVTSILFRMRKELKEQLEKEGVNL